MYTHSCVLCVHAEMQTLQFSQEQSQLLNWDYSINTGIIIFKWASYANVMGSPLCDCNIQLYQNILL